MKYTNNSVIYYVEVLKLPVLTASSQQERCECKSENTHTHAHGRFESEKETGFNICK